MPRNKKIEAARRFRIDMSKNRYKKGASKEFLFRRYLDLFYNLRNWK